MDILYTLKKSFRSNNIRISVKRNGSVIVTKPYFTPNFIVKKFINDKKDWIEKKILEFQSLPKQHINTWGNRTVKEFKNNKIKAYNLALNKVEKYAELYKVNYKKIAIRNQKTRWGSCSAKGNLSFSYRIVFLPEELLDYLIVHEICHLKHFNHSRVFWNEVGLCIPSYKILRKKLRGIEG